MDRLVQFSDSLIIVVGSAVVYEFLQGGQGAAITVRVGSAPRGVLVMGDPARVLWRVLSAWAFPAYALGVHAPDGLEGGDGE